MHMKTQERKTCFWFRSTSLSNFDSLEPIVLNCEGAENANGQ
jgi:hypothetical protein